MGKQGTEGEAPNDGGTPPADGKGGTPPADSQAPDAVKLQEQVNNLNKALKEERDAKKAQEERLSKLDEYEKAEAKKKEDELKKKGEYDLLVTQKDSEIEKLKSDNARLTQFEAAHLKALETREADALSKVNPEKLELVKLAIEGKTGEARVSIIEKFAAEFKKPEDFGKQPNGGAAPNKTDAQKTKYEGKSFRDALSAGLSDAFGTNK